MRKNEEIVVIDWDADGEALLDINGKFEYPDGEFDFDSLALTCLFSPEAIVVNFPFNSENLDGSIDCRKCFIREPEAIKKLVDFIAGTGNTEMSSVVIDTNEYLIYHNEDGTTVIACIDDEDKDLIFRLTFANKEDLDKFISGVNSNLKTIKIKRKKK